MKTTSRSTQKPAAANGRASRDVSVSNRFRLVDELQHALGNQGMQRRLQAGPYLGLDSAGRSVFAGEAEINTPGDSYEQEADRVGERIAGSPVAPVALCAIELKRSTRAKVTDGDADEHNRGAGEDHDMKASPQTAKTPASRTP